MTNYRRNLIPGGCYFFTVNLSDRSSNLLTKHISILRSAFRTIRAELPFQIEAIVVLPDHLHCIWTLPPNDADFPTRWKKIKALFSKQILKSGIRSESQIDKGERGVWQRRYWEHTIQDELDFQRHVAYIHFNPVRHGHVKRVIDWPYSSFQRHVKNGLYPLDWAGENEDNADFNYGESVC